MVSVLSERENPTWRLLHDESNLVKGVVVDVDVDVDVYATITTAY